MVRLRAARAGEARELSALVMRSKAHWGYDRAYLAACAPALLIGESELAARRIVVAEDDRGPLGVSSLEGSPRGPEPAAELGLLFVAPGAMGRGVGRRLYRDALARAGELGFARLHIAADPHARAFYRAMGARPVPARDGLPCFEAVPAPEPGWVRAWTGGGRAVHLGNVAEFNAQFGRTRPEPAGRTEDHYACLAAFYSPHPAALVLPLSVPRPWLALVARRLEWDEVELYDGLAEEGAPLTAALRGRPALAARLRGLGLPVIPWGRAGADAGLRYESKSAANALFRRLVGTGGHPGIRVPEQTRVPGRRTAARLLTDRARAGSTTVLKTEHGVGGSGTTVVTPGRLRALGGPRSVVRALPRGPLLVEEFVPADGAYGDLTYDGFVDGAGRVHEVGSAVMEVAGTAYQGATVGPGAVPTALAAAAGDFGRAVGDVLAAEGYRGWYDVDFVADPEGRLAPTETNLRLTGPSVAFMVKARLDRLRGAGHLVRIVDRVPLGARLAEAELVAFLDRLGAACAALDALLIPAVPTAARAPAPYLGVLLAAYTWAALEAADALVRREAAALRAMFGEPELL
ncbi:GNAT family N-acetyltransferase [Streptomyces sp. NPDC089919]|uniref:GNAT family N-acetyltransferase n=1 Tax=Streptomyces sp. NPDC089919 TaxID=3155188 RepID=UPI00342862A8